MLRTIAFSLLFVTLFTGCLKGSNENTCTYDECAIKAPAAEIQAIQDYLTANNITATPHCSGVFYKIESEGTGARPTACSGVYVKYKGMFTSGAVFDESPANGSAFYLNQLIAGWTPGISQIKQGGKITLYIPPSLGYGNQDRTDPQTGQVRIPANSILVFDIELLGVQ